MERVSIKKNYEYWHFPSDIEFFEALEELLNKGYEITDSILLCVELCKEEQYILLSYMDIEVSQDENIKESLREYEVEYKLVYPNYEQCILNTIASIRNKLGGEAWYKLDANIEPFLDKNYKNYIILLLDGMGENVLENNLSESSFLRRNHCYTNTAIFPSTTAAATTATKCGFSPIRTGWLGWENYFRELSKNLILFSGVDYFTDEPTGFDPHKVLPYQPFFHDLDVEGCFVEPDFSNHERNIKDVLDNSLKRLKKNKTNIQYVYFTEPDSIMHVMGTYSTEARETLEQLDTFVEDYAKKLPEDTLLIITADHGHTNVKKIDFYRCTPLLKMLKRKPSNDSRCVTFCVKEEYKEEFPKLFSALFGYAYELYSSEELIKKGFFGSPSDIPHSRVKDFLGDYVGIATKEFYFNYKNELNVDFKSHHAGLTADEMLVPVIVFRK